MRVAREDELEVRLRIRKSERIPWFRGAVPEPGGLALGVGCPGVFALARALKRGAQPRAGAAMESPARIDTGTSRTP